MYVYNTLTSTHINTFTNTRDIAYVMRAYHLYNLLTNEFRV